MKRKLIGHVGVDSGQLLLCDPCYIDSEWKKEPFHDVRIYEHKTTKNRLRYGRDFANYEQVIPEYGKSMNQLNETGEWELLAIPNAENNFSYNACCSLTLSEQGYGQLNYSLGHDGIGVAFATGVGDGFFPVWAVYEGDELIKVEVEF